MNSNIEIAVIQFTPTWQDKTANYTRLALLLKGLKADLIVLPELCTTGYSFLSKMEVLELADSAADIASFFQPFSDKSAAVIIAGFAEKDGDGVYNSAIIVSPNSPYQVYRKTHLFYKEKLCFEAGNSGFIVIPHPIKDCRIGVMVCYDWRFPESARTLALMGADIIACPANLVTSVWEIGMKSRALENNIFVAVANRCGAEERILEDTSIQALTFTGKSVIYHINGSELVQADMTNDSIIRYAVDLKQSRNKHFNEYNNIFKDRKPSLYKLD